MSVSFVNGDLVEQKGVDAIVHQVNCLTVKAHGLSQYIADCFPWADIYATRRPIKNLDLAVPEDRCEPGTIKVFMNPKDDGDVPAVICLLAQLDDGNGRGRSRDRRPHEDTAERREEWFVHSLNCIAQQHDFKTLAFPYRIGCGMAGGNWSKYLGHIRDFALHTGIDCRIVKPMSPR